MSSRRWLLADQLGAGHFLDDEGRSPCCSWRPASCSGAGGCTGRRPTWSAPRCATGPPSWATGTAATRRDLPGVAGEGRRAGGGGATRRRGRVDFAHRWTRRRCCRPAVSSPAGRLHGVGGRVPAGTVADGRLRPVGAAPARGAHRTGPRGCRSFAGPTADGLACRLPRGSSRTRSTRRSAASSTGGERGGAVRRPGRPRATRPRTPRPTPGCGTSCGIGCRSTAGTRRR